MVDIAVGAGGQCGVGQTVVVRYGAPSPNNLPEVFMLGSGDVADTLDGAVRGMRVGGKRRQGNLEFELVKVL